MNIDNFRRRFDTMDNRTIGIALMIFGAVFFQLAVFAQDAIFTHLANPNEDLRNAALVNARLSIAGAFIGAFNLSILTLLAIKVHYLAKIVKGTK